MYMDVSHFGDIFLSSVNMHLLSTVTTIFSFPSILQEAKDKSFLRNFPLLLYSSSMTFKLYATTFELNKRLYQRTFG